MIITPHQFKRTPSFPCQIDWAQAPRGLRNCIIVNNPLYVDFAKNIPASFFNSSGGNRGVAASPLGLASSVTTVANNGYQAAYVPSSQPSKCSVECLIYFLPSFNVATQQGPIVGISQSTPNNTTNDRIIGVNTSGTFNFEIFSGAAKIVTSVGAVVPGSIYHVVGVSDGTNITIYINGVSSAQLAAGTAYQGYTAPVFCVGSIQAGSSGLNSRTNCGDVQIIMANFATEAWTAQEVMGRFVSPFGFIAPRRMVMRGVIAAGATSIPFFNLPQMGL